MVNTTDENSPINLPSGVKNTLAQSYHKVSPFFDSLSIKIGKNKMQFWLDSIHYGRTKIDSNLVQLRFNSTLKISPDEQLGLIERLYFSKLPFQKRTQTIAKKLLQIENNPQYSLAFNQGITYLPNHEYGYWMTGWIIENKHVYFFSQFTKSNNEATIRQKSTTLLHNILRHYGFFEGKK